jgi:cytochrome c heme-lyase
MPPSSDQSSSACPVDHNQHSSAAAASPQSLICNSAALAIPPQLPRMSGGTCPVDHSQFKSQAAASAAAATAHSGSGGVGIVGDHFPDATRGPNQRMPLSTAPVASKIPRGGVAPPGQPPLSDDATWIFPSPQRFYNAMEKKGWNPHEPDMAWVVSIHNTVNERTWQEVMAYERLHASTCANPKLSRFRGRPSDLSPKARIRGWFGAIAPFDRHDWVVDRCGKEVRYIIDFYQGPQAFLPDGLTSTGNTNASPLVGAPPSIHLDVRPALTLGGSIDRIRMQFNKMFSV